MPGFGFWGLAFSRIFVPVFPAPIESPGLEALTNPAFIFTGLLGVDTCAFVGTLDVGPCVTGDAELVIEGLSVVASLSLSFFQNFHPASTSFS